MKLPELRAVVNQELSRRLADGDTFEICTTEANQLIAMALAYERPH